MHTSTRSITHIPMSPHSAAVRCAKYLLAQSDNVPTESAATTPVLVFIGTDVASAEALNMSIRKWRDSLRVLNGIGAISREELDRGPVAGGHAPRPRAVLINIGHPYWDMLRAADEISNWER